MWLLSKRSNRIEDKKQTVTNRNKIQSNNKPNFNSNKDMLEIVIPGHYCSKDTLNSKVKNIIRIIGPNIRRQGYWIDDSGKNYNESILLDEYVLLDTKSHQPGQSFGKAQVRKRKDIMGDFKPVKIDEDDEDDDYVAPYQRKLPEHLNINQKQKQKQQIQEQQQKHPIQEQPVKKIDPFAETKKLIEKASIESLNKNYQKKYGTTYYKSEVISVPIQIEIPYELNKLSQICELFELDTKEVAQIIFNNIRLPEEIILSIILDKLNNPNKQIQPLQPEQVQPLQPEQVQSHIIQQPTQVPNKEVNQGIDEIDDYLKNMFGK